MRRRKAASRPLQMTTPQKRNGSLTLPKGRSVIETPTKSLTRKFLLTTLTSPKKQNKRTSSDRMEVVDEVDRLPSPNKRQKVLCNGPLDEHTSNADATMVVETFSSPQPSASDVRNGNPGTSQKKSCDTIMQTLHGRSPNPKYPSLISRDTRSLTSLSSKIEADDVNEEIRSRKRVNHLTTSSKARQIPLCGTVREIYLDRKPWRDIDSRMKKHLEQFESIFQSVENCRQLKTPSTDKYSMSINMVGDEWQLIAA